MWHRLLINAKYIDKELYPIFKRLNELGAELQQYNVKPKNKNLVIPTIKMVKCKIDADTWNNKVRPVLLKYTDKIRLLFKLTAMCEIIEDVDLNQMLPEEWL